MNVNLANYRLPAGSNEPRGPLSDADRAITKAKELAQFIPVFAPRDVYANPMGGMGVPLISYNDLRTAGANPNDDAYLLSIQFNNINVAGGQSAQKPKTHKVWNSQLNKFEDIPFDTGDQVDVGGGMADGTDPVLAYGPLFSLLAFMSMLRSGDPGQFRDWVQGMYGQPGMGGGGDQTKANEAMIQLLNAPNVKAAISAVLTSGL